MEEKYSKLTMIAFAEWLEENYYKTDAYHTKRIWFLYGNEHNIEIGSTTEELLTKFLSL